MEDSAYSKYGKRCDLCLPSVASRIPRHFCEICQRISDTSTNESNRTIETFHCCHHPHSNAFSSNNECSRLLPDLVLSCTPPEKSSLSLNAKECGSLLKCMADNFERQRCVRQIGYSLSSEIYL
ncbi:hypothetical protein HNY73_007541 [Argiope bruennichi]|uniref:Uncharacterized protein n=1 Tax=Argiope bruennichi TaxID=94029 RepID=A0A8T0FGT6_ARGBR|nr:hypothetical protein HNY73_007541 [Argiope bruennichi]